MTTDPVSITLVPLSTTDVPEPLLSVSRKRVVDVVPGAPAAGVKRSASSAAVSVPFGPDVPIRV